jgi:hypothetical protein
MTFHEKRPEVSIDNERRAALRTIGLGTLAVLSTSVTTSIAHAQDAPRSAMATRTPMEAGKLETIKAIQLGKLDKTQLEMLKLTQRISGATPITRMGLTDEGVKYLTPAASKLTKSDLEALGRGEIDGANVRGLTVNDVESVRHAFGHFYRPGVVYGQVGGGIFAADGVSCCCCTPCCCAAAVTEPLKIAA